MFTVVSKEIIKYCNYFDYKGSDKLFPGSSRHTLSTTWKNIFKTLKIENRTIHDWRHYLGSWIAVVTNGNVHAIQDALAHKTITTSQYYIDEWMRDKAFGELDNIVNEEKY